MCHERSLAVENCHERTFAPELRQNCNFSASVHSCFKLSRTDVRARTAPELKPNSSASVHSCFQCHERTFAPELETSASVHSCFLILARVSTRASNVTNGRSRQNWRLARVSTRASDPKSELNHKSFYYLFSNTRPHLH